MKILIIVNNYTQKNIISGKRWRIISRELVSQGNEVTVLCGTDPWYSGDEYDISELATDELNIVKLDTTDFFFQYRNGQIIRDRARTVQQGGTKTSSPGSGISLTRLLKKWVSKELREYSSVNILKKSIFYQQFCADTYDVILASIFHENAFYMGNYLKKKSPNSVFICEIRDPLTHQIVPCKEYDMVYAGFAKRIYKSADAVFFVGESVLNSFAKDVKCAPWELTNAYIFPHIYSPDDNEQDTTAFPMTASSRGTLHLTFTGTIYDCFLTGEFRLLFLSISRLITQSKLQKANIHLTFAGLDVEKIRPLSKEYELTECVSLLGLIPKAQARTLQQMADILVCVGTEVTGKVPEYLNSHKVILSIYSSNQISCPVSIAIEKAKAGKSINASVENAESEMQDFILKCLNWKKQFGELKPTLDENFILEFRADTIAGNMLKTMKSISKEKSNC